MNYRRLVIMPAELTDERIVETIEAVGRSVRTMDNGQGGIKVPRETAYRTAEAAAYLGVCRETLETLAGRGEVVRYKMGGLWFYRERDLDAFEARRHAQGVSEAEKRLAGSTGGKNVISLRVPRKEVTEKEALSVWRS